MHGVSLYEKICRNIGYWLNSWQKTIWDDWICHATVHSYSSISMNYEGDQISLRVCTKFNMVIFNALIIDTWR